MTGAGGNCGGAGGATDTINGRMVTTREMESGMGEATATRAVAVVAAATGKRAGIPKRGTRLQ